MDGSHSLSFSAWLKTVRAMRDWTQADLAVQADVAVESVRRFEQDPQSRPSKRSATLLAGCLGIPLEEQSAFVLWARQMPDAAPPPSVVAAFRPRRNVSSPTALLIPLTPLIGRERDVANITAQLRDPTLCSGGTSAKGVHAHRGNDAIALPHQSVDRIRPIIAYKVLYRYA